MASLEESIDQSPPTKRLRRTLDNYFTSFSINSQSEEDNIIEVSSHSTETGTAINTIATSGSASGEIRIPDIWSPDMWESKKKDYPWLFCQDGTLGCLICQKVSCLSLHKRRGVYITTEWSGGLVNYYGDTKEARLKSLRKKIVRHKTSHAHTIAEEIILSAEKSCIESHIDNLRHLELEDTKRIFRTAYYLAKNNRPYTDHHDLVELQQLNGTDLGVGLHSSYSATEIIDHITFQMRLRICSRIQEIEGKIALIIDESTIISNISTLVVYLKCETSKLECPQFMFLDLTELAKQDASTILGSLLNCMENYGFNNHYLSQHY